MRAKIEIVTAMLIFGSIGIFVKSIDISSGMLALTRGIIGTFFLMTFSFMGKKRGLSTAGAMNEEKAERKTIRRNGALLLISGAAIGANWICLFESYRYTTVAVATLCYYLAPVFVIAVSPIVLKERLTLRKAGCVAVSLFGMMLVAGIEKGSGGGTDAGGIAFGVTAALLYASVVVMNKQLKDIRAVNMTICQLWAAAMVLFPYVLLTEGTKVPVPAAGTVLLLLTVGIVHTGIAYLLYFSSLKKLSGQRAALFSYIDPVTAIILSALLLHEEMSIPQAAGAVLILGSTLFSEITGKPEKEPAAGRNGI